jgi:hypothetical protein
MTILQVLQVLSNPTSKQGQDREPKLAPPLKSKFKARVQRKDHVSKKPKKKPRTPPTSPPKNQSSREASSISKGGLRNETMDKPPFIPQDQASAMSSQYSPPIICNGPSTLVLQNNSPRIQVMQVAPPKQSLPQYGHQVAGQPCMRRIGIHASFGQPYQQSHPAIHSSRVEDVALAPSSRPQQNGPPLGQQYIRS